MSAIDITKPIEGSPTTESVRDNFNAAATEIDAATSTANGAVQRSGDTMTGPLIQAANPTAPLGTATKQYVDAVSTAQAGYVPLAGGTMTGPLIQAADPVAPLGSATKQYVDAAVAGATGSALTNKGRNGFHNPLFNVQQRGAGPFTVNGAYTADRWLLALLTDTASVSPQALSDTARAQIGDEAAIWGLRNVFTGNAAAGAYNFVAQRIENVRRYSGKTITVSFWAQASAALNLGIGLAQIFGTGGSPSAGVNMNGQAVALGTTFQRYSVSFAVPSSAGKTFGTNLDDYTQLSFWFSSGATNAVIAGSPGVQSGTVFLWGMQVEVASAASALDRPDIADDWARCLRFFQYHPNVITFSYAAAGGNVINVYPYVPRMRATPQASLDTPSYLNASGANVVAYPTAVRLQCVATALGTAWASFNLTLTADL